MNCAHKPLSEWTMADKYFTLRAYMGVVAVATRAGDTEMAEKYRQHIEEAMNLLDLSEEELLLKCLSCTVERTEQIMAGFHEFNRLSHVLQNLGIPTLVA